MLNSTKGGSRETELNEFTAMPSFSPPAPTEVTTATPVAKHPKASRSTLPSLLSGLIQFYMSSNGIMVQQTLN